MARGAKKAWPSWRYGPGGAKKIFEEGDKVPDGWEDHPDKVQEPKSRPQSGKGKGADKDAAAKAAAAEEARYRSDSIEFLKAAGRDVSSITDETPLADIEALMNEVEKEGAQK